MYFGQAIEPGRRAPRSIAVVGRPEERPGDVQRIVITKENVGGEGQGGEKLAPRNKLRLDPSPPMLSRSLHAEITLGPRFQQLPTLPLTMHAGDQGALNLCVCMCLGVWFSFHFSLLFSMSRNDVLSKAPHRRQSGRTLRTCTSINCNSLLTGSFTSQTEIISPGK